MLMRQHLLSNLKATLVQFDTTVTRGNLAVNGLGQSERDREIESGRHGDRETWRLILAYSYFCCIPW